MTAYTSARQQNTYRPMNRRQIYFAVLSICLLIFEVSSYLSSRYALNLIIGWETWSKLIAFAFCAVDLAGLPLIRAKRNHPDLVRMLSLAWGLSVIGDTAMTWYVVAVQTSNTANRILIQSGILKPEFITVYFPLGIAIVAWAIQTLLVHSFNRSADKIFNR